MLAKLSSVWSALGSVTMSLPSLRLVQPGGYGLIYGV